MNGPDTLKNTKTVLWAINPFEEETRPGPVVIEELRKWLKASGFILQPVHLLYVSASDAPHDERGSWGQQFVPAVEAEITRFLKTLDLPGIQAPRVIVHHGASLHDAVDALVRHAQDTDAAWILVSSKGRSGIRRMALGSFAEGLLLRSPVPVWVFGHGEPASLDPRRILFATDFSEVSKSAFEKVVEQASRLGSRVTLFHCINLPEPFMSGAGAMGVSSAFPIDDYLKDQTEWARNHAVEWILKARASGVAVDLVIKEVVPNISNAIVFEAGQDHAGVIALVSRSGRASAILLGSHARQVIRLAECPVWVFGPKCREAAGEGSDEIQTANAG